MLTGHHRVDRRGPQRMDCSQATKRRLDDEGNPIASQLGPEYLARVSGLTTLHEICWTAVLSNITSRSSP